jgi:hypothetical protein
MRDPIAPSPTNPTVVIRNLRRSFLAGAHSCTVASTARGERLVCVRYLYDEQRSVRHKTIELIVDTVPWQPSARRPRRRDDEIIAVRIAWRETDLRERARRLGAVWRPVQKL